MPKPPSRAPKHQPQPAAPPRPGHAPVGPSMVQHIRLMNIVEPRHAVGEHYEATSLPGHLIQLILQGEIHQESNGRVYDLGPGSLIWYHEDELVRGHVIRKPWRFYTLNFIAPALPPPPFEARVRTATPSVRQCFEHLHAAWNDSRSPETVRQMRVQAALLLLLAELAPAEGVGYAMDPQAELWWQLETHFRQNPAQPMTLGDMVRITGRSPATIARSCKQAVGQPPAKRIKQIRMSLARGLVQFSDLRITEIAEQVGYPRVHEFSRDYKKAFGKPPSDER